MNIKFGSAESMNSQRDLSLLKQSVSSKALEIGTFTPITKPFTSRMQRSLSKSIKMGSLDNSSMSAVIEEDSGDPQFFDKQMKSFNN